MGSIICLAINTCHRLTAISVQVVLNKQQVSETQQKAAALMHVHGGELYYSVYIIGGP